MNFLTKLEFFQRIYNSLFPPRLIVTCSSLLKLNMFLHIVDNIPSEQKSNPRSVNAFTNLCFHHRFILICRVFIFLHVTLLSFISALILSIFFPEKCDLRNFTGLFNLPGQLFKTN